MEDKKEDILERAQGRYDIGTEYLSENWKQMRDDIRFGENGEQWPDDIKTRRKAKNRPCITINRLPAFMRQVIGSQRQMRPSIKVRPVDSNADVDMAEARSDIVRHIEYKSKAKHAYDHGFKCALSGGMGYWRVTTDYAGPMTFEQDIIIERIFDPFSVILDPYAVAKDKSDAKWGFIERWISKDEYETRWPDAEVVSFQNATKYGYTKWVTQDQVLIATYYETQETKKTIYLLEDGSVVEDEPEEYVKKRETIDCKVICRIISATDILETKDWPSPYIPIIPCYGEEIYKEGRAYYLSLIHWAKDAQMMYNFWNSADTEFIALQPKAPYLATVKQITGFENDWANANSDNNAVLYYNVDPEAPGAPQRQMPPQLSTAIGTAALRSVDDMKATMGLFDPSLGNRSNAADSGKAINALQRQGETSTYIWIDNLSTAINHTGRIIISLIPEIYDTARVFRIQGEDGANKEVKVNTLEYDEKGAEIMINDLTVGEYDVVVETGPSFATKRAEASDSMLKMLSADPGLMQKAGDLFFKNMDVPGSEDLAERYRKTLPPGLVEPEDGEEPAPPAPPTPAEELESQKLQIETQKLEVEKMKVEVEAEKVMVEAENNKENEEEKMRRIAMDVVAEIHGGDTLD